MTDAEQTLLDLLCGRKLQFNMERGSLAADRIRIECLDDFGGDELMRAITAVRSERVDQALLTEYRGACQRLLDAQRHEAKLGGALPQEVARAVIRAVYGDGECE